MPLSFFCTIPAGINSNRNLFDHYDLQGTEKTWAQEK